MNPFYLKHWHPFTGIIHFLLALFTTTSMFTSLFINDYPSWILLHGISGIGLLLTVSIQWIWSFCYKKGEMLYHFFPLLKDQYLQIWKDFRNLIKGKIPPRGQIGGLPGLIEGFGLLAVTAMVCTGPFLFGDYLLDHRYLQESFAPLLDVHGFFANLVWIYWFGHVGMALITFLVEKVKKDDQS